MQIIINQKPQFAYIFLFRSRFFNIFSLTNRKICLHLQRKTKINYAKHFNKYCPVAKRTIFGSTKPKRVRKTVRTYFLN